MESHLLYGEEQAFPIVGSEVVSEKPSESEREAKQKPSPETVWTRLDPNHLQLPLPQPNVTVEARSVPTIEQVPPNPRPNSEQPKASQPESVGELLKAQTLPNLDIRPQHFYSDAEINSAHQAAQEHDILPEVSPTAARTKVEQFSGEIEPEPKTVTKAASAEANPGSSQLHLDRHELMLLAGTVSVVGTNLLEIFSSGRIDEDGLRRIVAEFLQGHPVEKLLQQEELRQQMKFELDPSFRHSPEGTESIVKRLASGAGTRAKKAVDPQHIKHRAGTAATLVTGGIERMLEVRDEPPSPAKLIAWTAGIVLYFIILIWALKR